MSTFHQRPPFSPQDVVYRFYHIKTAKVEDARGAGIIILEIIVLKIHSMLIEKQFLVSIPTRTKSKCS